MRQIALALALILGLANGAAAQAPPPVPALPDSTRLTSYSIITSTCACSVGFAIYGSGTDVDEWIQVYVNGIAYLSTDPTFGWSLSSVTGSLGSIPRPITNAVLTFNAAQTATVVIVGDERPRRLTQFPENRGVTGRDLNQAITDVVAVQRELWDKSNRSITGQPGEVFPSLPPAASRPNTYLCFDSNGLPIVCQNVSGSGGSITLPGSSVNGDSVCFNGTTGTSFSDCNWKITGTPSAGKVPSGSGTAGAAVWAGDCLNFQAFGGVGDGTTANDTAWTSIVAALPSGGGCIFFPPGKFRFNSSSGITLPSGIYSFKLACAGRDLTTLYWPSTDGLIVTYSDGSNNSTQIEGCTFAAGSTNTSTGLTLTFAGTTGNPSNVAQNDIINSTFRGNDGYAANNLWATAIKILSVSNINIIGANVVGGSINPVIGYAGSSGNGTGLSLLGTSNANSVAINISSSIFDYLTSGIIYGNGVQGVTIANSNFTGGYEAIVIPAGAAFIDEFTITGSQFNAAVAGIVSNSPMVNMSISNNLFIIDVASGFGVVLSQYGATAVNSNFFQCGTLTGTAGLVFTLAATQAPSSVIGNSFYNCGNGLNLSASTATQVLVMGNSFNNTTLLNSGVGNVIVNNPGYNPVGYTAGTSTGTSASVISAGASPETHYITQSANFNAVVAKCTALACGTSTNICTVPSATVPCVLNLGPNENYKVTWTTTQPTYTKDVH